MAVSSAHNTVHQTAFIGKEKKPLRIFIQTSYRIYAKRIFQIFGDCHFILLLLCAADDSSWLVKKQKNFFFVFYYGIFVNADKIFCRNLFPALRFTPVYRNAVFRNQAVCLSSGAYACIA